MQITRRTFLKGSAAAAGVAASQQFLFGGLQTLTAGTSQELALATQEDWVPTTCWIGKQDCGILARRIGGRVVKLEGDPNHPRNMGTLCPKGVSQIAAVYDPNRVKTPLIRESGSPKGQQGEFRQATWDEALTLVAQKMNEVTARDPRLLLWQKGRSKAGNFYDTAFVKASGATKLHHGAYCSDAGYRACEYTIGLHGVLHPDFRDTRYLLAWGWNVTNAGGNKTCWLTWNQQLLEAKRKGMKVVTIDPRIRAAGPFADDWLPIRPGTDMALALALCNQLIRQGTIDQDYLKTYTNSTFLVQEDGTFLRVDGKEQVWDWRTLSPRAPDFPLVDPALDGAFTVDGATVKTAFQVFKDHVAQYTPEWAADTCGLSVDSILRVASDIAENADIGGTTMVDGVSIPHRPVAIMAYHMSQQELGFQTIRAMNMVMMLIGAFGAVGGQMIDYSWKIHKNFDGLDDIEITDEPNVYLNKSKFYPINSNNSSIVAQVMQDPEEYGVDYTPEVAIIHMANPLVSFASQADIKAAYDKLKFVAVIDPWLSQTADYYADVILPAATMEKYEGPLSATDQYTDAVTLRVPPMAPLFESRGDIDIYLDLCEKAGILTGEGGYIDQVNKALGLTGQYAVSLNSKPAVRDIFDRWAKSQGIAEGVAYFENTGVMVKGPLAATKRYGYATSPPFGGVRHRLYGESLMGYAQAMAAKGVGETYTQDYTALPTWRPPTMESSPSEYNLHLITYKLIEFKQSRGSQIPLLAELAPRQRLDINPKTARQAGVDDGDEVQVESHNAVTGETRRVTVRANFTEAIRPDTVGMPHHYGEIARHPWTKDQGPTANTLMFTGQGYVTNTADQSFHVKVRVTKA